MIIDNSENTLLQTMARLRKVSKHLQEMSQAEYNALHEVDWDALQDMQEVCQRIASRIAALDSAAFVGAAKVLPEEPLLAPNLASSVRS